MTFLLGKAVGPFFLRKVQTFLEQHIPFRGKSMWPPCPPDANPLDFVFWVYVERKACRQHHPNMEAPKVSVNAEWDGVDETMVKRSCAAFRKRLEAIVVAKGSHIEQ